MKPFAPHGYQVEGIKLLVSPKGGGLFLKPGMGKTAMALAAFKLLKNKGIIRSMIVIAPLRVTQLVWPEEISGWLDFEDFSFTVLHGPNKDARLKERVDIYLVNYEGLEWLIPKIWFDNALSHVDLLVLDESSKVRNTDSKRYKLLKKVAHLFSRRWILTGTPRPKNLLNIFGQIFLVDGGKTLGRYISKFRAQYFHKIEADEHNWYPNPGSADRIHDMIAPMIYHASDKEYLNLPPLVEEEIWVELDGKAKSNYQSMATQLFADLEAGLVTAVNAGVRVMKLRQICNGFMYHSEDGEQDVEIFGDQKLKAFVDLIEELDEPVMVIYQFEADYQRMNKLKPGVKFTGHKDPEAVKEAWDNGQVDILYVHPKSAGYGLNMQKGGRAMIWMGVTYDYEDYFQTIKRLHRQGQKREVVIYRIVARNTIEPQVMLPNLRRREIEQESMFTALRKYWRNKLDSSAS